MKAVKFLLLLSACFWLTSCLEINEDVEIKNNGSGNVSTTTDLSQLIDMMQAFGGEEFEKRKNEKIDTVFNMKQFVDTASKLTAHQKELLKDGKVRLKMDLPSKIFNINMQFPFTSLENYQQLTSLLNSNVGSIGNVMKSVLGGNNGNAAKDSVGIVDQPAPGNSPDMDQLTSVFDFNISNGLIKKTLNAEKYKKLMDEPQIQQLKQSADMGLEMLYTTTYTLPRPVKKVDNPAAKLSSDKKQVTIRQNLLDIFSAPQKFEYTIVY